MRIKLRNGKQVLGAITPVGAGPRCLPSTCTTQAGVSQQGRQHRVPSEAGAYPYAPTEWSLCVSLSPCD